jgi:hypothetical protein
LSDSEKKKGQGKNILQNVVIGVAAYLLVIDFKEKNFMDLA